MDVEYLDLVCNLFLFIFKCLEQNWGRLHFACQMSWKRRAVKIISISLLSYRANNSLLILPHCRWQFHWSGSWALHIPCISCLPSRPITNIVSLFCRHIWGGTFWQGDCSCSEVSSAGLANGIDFWPEQYFFKSTWNMCHPVLCSQSLATWLLRKLSQAKGKNCTRPMRNQETQNYLRRNVILM